MLSPQEKIAGKRISHLPATKIPVPEVFKGFANFLGVRTSEEPPYSTLVKDGEKEIRSYGPISTAQVKINGDYESSNELGFYQLAEYIFGKNTRESKIEMTAPVLQQRTSLGWMIGFVLPQRYNAANAPAPLNSRIELCQRSAELVATLRYSGWTSKKIIYAKSKELFTWIEKQGEYKMISKPRSAVYDPPFVLPFLRKNEIHVTVVPKKMH